MCGFVFAFDFEQHKRVNTNVVKNMISELNHRGPDDSEIYIDNKRCVETSFPNFFELLKKWYQ